MIPQEIIDDILRRTSIVEVIGQYVSLKKAGHNYKGLCPFHNDKNNPSLHISEQKGLYHCFSCGAGGNALTFLKEYSKLDFVDSIKVLGKMVGVDVELYLNKQDNTLPLRNKIKTMHEITQDYFHKSLFNIDNPQVELAVKTIRQRKLDKKTIELFGLGFGGQNWDNLFKTLQSQGFKTEEIIASGLCGQNNNGKLYDRFRNRITFPISDSEGNIVAFGGRIIDNSSPAKYINSPETILFKKGSILYGWHLAKDNALESGQVIIVEGYMDVIRMFQAGFANAVAPLGTGLTEDRIQYLKHKVDTIILCFDGDNAGQKSAYRSAGIAAKLDIPTKIAILPDGEDPDTFLLKNGPNAMANIIANSQEAVQFILDSAQKFLPDSNKFLQEVFEYAVHLEGESIVPTLSIKTSQFLKKVSEILQVAYTSVELEFSRFKQHNNNSTNHTPSPTPAQNSEYDAEFELMSILVMFPEFIDQVASLIDISDFQHKDTKETFTQMLLHPEKSAQDWIISIGNTDFIKQTGKWIDPPDIRIIQNYAVSLKIKSLKKQQTLINSEISNYPVDSENHLELSKKIINIQQELIVLKQKFYHL